jgi:DNA helicase-2/ATP-dependent DNA helicase PcrA
MPEERLASLTPAQQEAVTHTDGPCLVIAGAGTGKTRVITERITHLILERRIAPDHIVALTYTEKAAAEMQERLDELLPYGMFGVVTSTFHAFCNELIRRHAFRLGINPEARLVLEADQIAILREHIDRLPLELYRRPFNPMRLLKDIAAYVEQAKEARITPAELIAHAEAAYTGAYDEAEQETAAQYLELAKCYEAIVDIYKELDVLTYADLLAHARTILADSAAVRKDEQDRCTYLLIDEFQDTNTIQAEIAYLLAGERANLFVVGDDDQAIYRFRGANVTNIINFTKQYPTAKVITLLDNYRSNQPILDAAYRLIQNNNPHRLESYLNINKKLIAHNEAGSTPEHLRFSTGSHEAEGVAARIQALLETGTYRLEDIAILGRSHNQLAPFAQELEALGIPANRSKEANFYEEPSVLQALAFLRFLSHPNDSQNLFRLLTGAPFDLTPAELVPLNIVAKKRHGSLWSVLCDESVVRSDVLQDTCGYLDGVLETDAAKSPSFAMRSHLTKSGWNKRLYDEAEEQAANHLNILHRQIKTFELLHPTTTIGQYVEHAFRLIESGESIAVDSELNPPEEGIALLTAHAAKGLEFPVVFVVNLTSTRFPLKDMARGFRLPADLVTPLKDQVTHEEERRLAYVACTRAKELLYLTSAEKYGTNKTLSKPSPFIQEALMVKEEPALADAPLRGTSLTAPPSSVADSPLIFPAHLSASALEAYEDNPAEFYEQHVLHIIQEDQTAMDFGNAVHNTLRDHFNAQKAGETIDIRTTLERYWKAENYYSSKEEEVREREAAVSMVEHYLGELPSDLDVALVEESITLQLPSGMRIIGKVDRIDRNSDGSYSIIDYKTGSFDAKPSDVRDNLPLALYAAALQQQGKVVRDISLCYLRTKNAPCFKITPDFLDVQLERAESLVAKLKTAYATRDFPDRPKYYRG